MGPRNFAITRENLRAKEKREPTQGEIFIETRKGNKGKQLDPETTNAISQVQQLIENEECSGEALQAVLGKECNGMMLCMGRNVTKTSLKQKEKINALKQAHNEEVASLNEKMESLGDTVGKLQYAFGVLLQQCRPGISVESLLEDLIGISPGDINSSPKVVRQPHSSFFWSRTAQCPNADNEGLICTRAWGLIFHAGQHPFDAGGNRTREQTGSTPTTSQQALNNHILLHLHMFHIAKRTILMEMKMMMIC